MFPGKLCVKTRLIDRGRGSNVSLLISIEICVIVDNRTTAQVPGRKGRGQRVYGPQVAETIQSKLPLHSDVRQLDFIIRCTFQKSSYQFRRTARLCRGRTSSSDAKCRNQTLGIITPNSKYTVRALRVLGSRFTPS